MILKNLILFALLCFGILRAAPGDTTKIRVHDAVDMVWYQSYDQSTVFPSSGVTYSKILMHYTMGCASTGCSDWDYTTKIEVRKPIGLDSTMQITVISEDPYIADTTWNVFTVKESFELARVITPYGSYMRNANNGFTPNWTHVHTFDITDYAPLLIGETEIRAFYGGWSSGFSVTLDFEFIEGTPPRNVIEIRNLWQTGPNGWNYQNDEQFESTRTSPKSVDFPSNFNGAKIRFIPTGHGFDNNQSCAEFCVKNYYLKLDGIQFGSNNMWDNQCGMNPIFPQGGTWLYDRANWCPGLRAHTFDHEIGGLVSQGSTHIIDLDIEPITWSGTQAPNYIFETQLFLYGSHNHQVDAAIEDILAPTKKDDHKRLNPICNHARVVIKNYGAQNLTSATIEYAVNENNWRTYQWHGNLAFDESEEVYLPLTEPWEWVLNSGENKFEVRIKNPNQSIDENNLNDVLSSSFSGTVKLPNNMIFQTKTNNKPEETSWTLHDGYGNLLKQNVSNLAANTIYNDTFALEPGCYVLEINDSGKNGLSFWANNDGTGFARLRVGSAIIHNFRADFGTKTRLYFTVGYTLNSPEIEQKTAEIHVFPNPNNGAFTVLFDNLQNQEVSVELVNSLGQNLQSKNIFLDDYTFQHEFDLRQLSSGTYFILVTSKNSRFVKQIIIQ